MSQSYAWTHLLTFYSEPVLWLDGWTKINKYSALKRENVFRSGDSRSFWSLVLQVFKGTWPQKAPSEWRYLLLHVYLSDLEPCCRSLERQCCFSTGLSPFDYCLSLQFVSFLFVCLFYLALSVLLSSLALFSLPFCQLNLLSYPNLPCLADTVLESTYSKYSNFIGWLHGSNFCRE